MSKLRLTGSTSGFTELTAPAVAGSNTLTLPTSNGSADQALVTNGSGTLSFADRGRMTLGTSVASTSGTSIDFTGIPSYVKRVTVIFAGVSLSGSSAFLIQLGTSSGFVTTGYSGGGSRLAGSGGSTSFTTGFSPNNNTAATLHSGNILITNITGNTWVASGVFGGDSNDFTFMLGGFRALSATLDRVRITTVNGTDTFDAGSINIMYEG